LYAFPARASGCWCGEALDGQLGSKLFEKQFQLFRQRRLKGERLSRDRVGEREFRRVEEVALEVERWLRCCARFRYFAAGRLCTAGSRRQMD
jgi:hypothetical protein